ncbi:alternative cyclin pcl12, partial [Moniliophthora roreri]
QQSQAKLPYFIACILCCIELHFLESKCFYALAASGALFSVVAGGLNLEDFQLYTQHGRLTLNIRALDAIALRVGYFEGIKVIENRICIRYSVASMVALLVLWNSHCRLPQYQ